MEREQKTSSSNQRRNGKYFPSALEINEALQSALMVKMIRIGFIIVVVLGMNLLFTIKEQKEARSDAKNLFMTALKSFPGFVIAFFVVVLANTMVNIPESIKGPLATYPATKAPFTLASLLLTMAIIGICCNCTAQTIKSAGMEVLGVGFIAFLSNRRSCCGSPMSFSAENRRI